MAKSPAVSKAEHISKPKKTSQALNYMHKASSTNKHNTKKMYRGQGK
jgi:hypothetical protein